jgi:hypothetical protein
VDRKHHFDVAIPVDQLEDRTTGVLECRATIFSPVHRHQDASARAWPRQVSSMPAILSYAQQRVDDGVAGNKDPPFRHAFLL